MILNGRLEYLYYIADAQKYNKTNIVEFLERRRNLVASVHEAHAVKARSEDPATEPMLEGRWHILPSLQQARPDGKLTCMSGYYALYNAICLMENHEAGIRDRGRFGVYLNGVLPMLYDYRSDSSLENLTSKELIHIIGKRCPRLPVIVVERKALFTFASDTTVDLNKVLERTPENNHLQRFIDKEIDKFAIIAGLESETADSGSEKTCHWFTICFERVRDTIILKITDSEQKISDWDTDKLQTIILPFYLAANNLLRGAGPVKEDVLSEFFKEYQRSEAQQPHPARQHLDRFIDSIKRLKRSLKTYLESEMPQQIGETQHILTHARLCNFVKVVTRLLPIILAHAVEIDARNPLGEQIIRLYEAIRENMQKLRGAVSGINEDEEQTITKKMRAEPARPRAEAAVQEDGATRHARVAMEETVDRQKAVVFLATILRKLEAGAATISDYIAASDHAAEPAIQQPAAATQPGASQQPAAATQPDAAQPRATQPEAAQAEATQSEDGGSFVSYFNELQPDFLQLITRFLPDAITGLIGQLSKENHDPVRVLFVGPPGNGKTTIAQAIAQVCKRPFLFIQTASLGNSYRFSRENQIKTLEGYIERTPNAIILLDEIDAIGEFSYEPQRAAELLQSVIDFARKNYPRVVFIGTTNYKDKIPAPLLTRFVQNILTIDNPAKCQRKAIINYHIARLGSSGFKFRLKEDELRALVDQTEYFSIRDIESLFENAQGQISIQAGVAAIEEVDRHAPTHINGVYQGDVITSIAMEKARKAVLATITRPDSSFKKFGKGVLAVAEILSPFVPYANTALSCYSMYKSVQHRQEDIRRQEKQVGDSQDFSSKLHRESLDASEAQHKKSLEASAAQHAASLLVSSVQHSQSILLNAAQHGQSHRLQLEQVRREAAERFTRETVKPVAEYLFTPAPSLGRR
jgi:tRNA uridine 5-carbamoylmethylation protein Kti12